MIIVAKEAPNNQIAVKSIVVHEATNDSNLSIVNKRGCIPMQSGKKTK